MNALEPIGVPQALLFLSQAGAVLRDALGFDWPVHLDHAAARLRLVAEIPARVSLVGIVGGASSGKSTLFNNLLGGRLASRVTARGHATLGPILAVHEQHADRVDRWFRDGLLWPGLKRSAISLDADRPGSPGEVLTATHDIDALADVLLVDTADFTSEDARREGDVTLALLPWFDRLIVVIDHERWFDRQSISELRRHASRLAQDRFVVFNRTQEGALEPAQQELLVQQARRLGAETSLTLEFRRGRGFCRFPPDTLAPVATFLSQPPPSRDHALRCLMADSARDVLNQNRERSVRLMELRHALARVTTQGLPKAGDALNAMMTSAEREHLDVVSRVLKLRQTREWLSAQKQRLDGLLQHVPFLDLLRSRSAGPASASAHRCEDRLHLATSYFEQCARRLALETQRAVRQSAFWIELSRWDRSAQPDELAFAWTPELRARLASAVGGMDQALRAWKQKVDDECRGTTPLLAGGLAGILLLSALPGPLTAIPLGVLLAAVGAGAAGAKPATRLTSMARERLLGTPEMAAAQQAIQQVLSVLESEARARAELHLEAARRRVLIPEDALMGPLTSLAALREDPS